MKPSVNLPRHQVLFGLLLITLVTPLQAAGLGLTKLFPDFALQAGLVVDFDFECAVGCGTNEGRLTIKKTVGPFESIATYTEVGLGGTLANAQVYGSGEFSLDAIIDTSGNLVTGSFFLKGIVAHPAFTTLYDSALHDPSGPGPTGNLLSGDLDDFGWTSAGFGLLEFTFINAGGVIADGVANHATIPDGELLELEAPVIFGGGMILGLDADTLLGDFETNALTQDWSSTTSGDVYVPVPAAVWLFGSGLFALLGLGRKRSKI